MINTKILPLLVLAVVLACPRADAEEKTTPFQISLFHPAQLHPDDYSVDGLRLNFIYGVNDNVQGIDGGLVNETRANEQGFELGGVNRVSGDFTGGQFGAFNEVEGNANFMQMGLVNITKGSYQGIQISAFYNDAAQEMRGLQVGLVNHTGSLNGVQIGLLNFNDDMKFVGFFPFVNAAF